jgi:hypothetical protein
VAKAVGRIALCLPILAACAATEPPATELAAAKNAVDQAAPVAMEYAASEWTAAQDKLTRAEQAYAKQDWRVARQLAEQAEVDAKYAQAIAERERVRAP